MNEIPDPIEIGEAAAERAFHKLYVDVDHMKCPICDKVFHTIKEGVYVWPDPFSPPVCGRCSEPYLRSLPQPGQSGD